MTEQAQLPLIVMVAPNGARRTKVDHPDLPLTPRELARTAAECLEAGACAMHLHVRDAGGAHSIDPALYRDGLAAIRGGTGDRLVCQVTTEAVGRYRPDEQMATVRSLRPEWVSLSVREIAADGAAGEPALADFLHWMRRERIVPQFILYDRSDVALLDDLRRRGIVPGGGLFLLFVLGRYAEKTVADPAELLAFLPAAEQDVWACCAFGPKESACVLAGAALGGHVRVGFENNLRLASGALAAGNAALVRQTVQAAGLIGRRPADADEARALVGPR